MEILTQAFELLNESDKSILSNLKPIEISQLLHGVLIKKVGILPTFKGQLLENRVSNILEPQTIQSEHHIVAKTPASTDIKVLRDNKVIYVEVKNYQGVVPQKEIDKFYRDLDTKINIHGAIFIGSKTGFNMHHGLPVLFITNDNLLNEAIEILLALDKRNPTKDTIRRIMESMDGLSLMTKTIDDMTLSFNKSINELRKSLIIFQERCKSLEIEYEENIDLNILYQQKCHLVDNDELYKFILEIFDSKTDIKKMSTSIVLTRKNLKANLLKTKTSLTFEPKDKSIFSKMDIDSFKYSKGLITIDLSVELLPIIREYCLK